MTKTPQQLSGMTSDGFKLPDGFRLPIKSVGPDRRAGA